MNQKLKVCFVCTGNTCRSIMAERVLKQLTKNSKIPNLSICSRGVCALGDNITENAKIVLKERGLCSRDRKSIKLKKIEKDMLYVVMTDSLKTKISGKVISMKDLTGRDIIDPYGQSVDVYRQTLKEIEIGVKILIEKILKVRGVK